MAAVQQFVTRVGAVLGGAVATRRQGQGMAEYALLLAGIAMVAIIGINRFDALQVIQRYQDIISLYQRHERVSSTNDPHTASITRKHPDALREFVDAARHSKLTGPALYSA